MSITVILTVFKRPHLLIEQINAIMAETVKPEKIIIYKNYVENIELPDIPEELKQNISIIKSNKNFGVWARFAIGLLANTEYICVFDDDTIPMPKWFENCLNTIKEYPGLLGTNGVIFNKGDIYEGKNIGWHSGNETTVEVDIVGHAWFFKRELLHYLWEYTPNYSKDLTRGEDIAFSANLQKHGIKTYVPPHPENNKELWGSNPDTGFKYGTNSAAISMTNGKPQFEEFLKDFIHNRGFITINNKNKNGGKRNRKTRKYKKHRK